MGSLVGLPYWTVLLTGLWNWMRLQAGLHDQVEPLVVLFSQLESQAVLHGLVVLQVGVKAGPQLGLQTVLCSWVES